MPPGCRCGWIDWPRRLSDAVGGTPAKSAVLVRFPPFADDILRGERQGYSALEARGAAMSGGFESPSWTIVVGDRRCGTGRSHHTSSSWSSGPV
jgi:hypothetical protein